MYLLNDYGFIREDLIVEEMSWEVSYITPKTAIFVNNNNNNIIN